MDEDATEDEEGRLSLVTAFSWLAAESRLSLLGVAEAFTLPVVLVVVVFSSYPTPSTLGTSGSNNSRSLSTCPPIFVAEHGVKVWFVRGSRGRKTDGGCEEVDAPGVSMTR